MPLAHRFWGRGHRAAGAGATTAALVLFAAACGARPVPPQARGRAELRASDYVQGIRLPDGIEMHVGCPSSDCVALTIPRNVLPLSEDPAVWLAAINRFRADALEPALAGLPGQTASDIVPGCRHAHVVAVFIASFARLPDYVRATSALMAHQRSPEVQICAGYSIELAMSTQ